MNTNKSRLLCSTCVIAIATCFVGCFASSVDDRPEASVRLESTVPVTLDVTADARTSTQSGFQGQPIRDRITIKRDAAMALAIHLDNTSRDPITIWTNLKGDTINQIFVDLEKNGWPVPTSPKTRDMPGRFQTLQPGKNAVHLFSLGYQYKLDVLIPGVYQVRIRYEINAVASDYTPMSLEKWIDLEIVD